MCFVGLFERYDRHFAETFPFARRQAEAIVIFVRTFRVFHKNWII